MYHRILVPLDGSTTAERGQREAIGLAVEQKATLHLLHAVDNFPMLVETASARNFEEMLDGLRRYGEELVAKAKRAAADAGVQADLLLCEVTQAPAADAIADEAGKAGCDLIVMGTNGRLSRLTMGSQAELVVE